MKSKLIVLLISTLSIVSVQAQVNDSVALGAGYVMQTFYSLENGEIAVEDNLNWDLAFSTELTGYSIRTNDGSGTQLFSYPNGDSSNWDDLDTLGLSTWSGFYNSDVTWNTGAFNQTENDLDVGWGDYNSITHVVTGDSLYITQLSNGDWKKLWIQELSGGIYTFKYADIDGTNEEVVTLSKFDYPGKNFAYYSIINNEAYDLEPAASTWDLVFTKYVSEVAPTQFYGVTGALANKGVTTAEASEVDVDNINYWDFEFSEEMNVIGYDWKTFNNQTFQYEIAEDLAYFVNDIEGNIWKIIMTGFGGSADGKMYFTKELISSNSVDELNTSGNQLNVYPNPTNGELVTLNIDLTDNTDALITIFDLTGKVIYTKNLQNIFGSSNLLLDIQDWAKGTYIVTLNTQHTNTASKLIVK